MSRAAGSRREAFVEEYRLTVEAERKEVTASRAKVECARTTGTGRIEHLTDMMADGIGDCAERKARLAAALARA